MIVSINLLQQVNIRYAQECDLRAFEWEGEYQHFRRLYQDIYRSVERGDALMWAAELAGGGIIGQLFVQLRSGRMELADGATRAYIYGFRIRPSFRGMGLGSRMLVLAEDDLQRRNFLYVVLNVSRENQAALALYSRHGYTISAEEPGRWSYVDDQGKQRWVDEPAWRMQKKLNQVSGVSWNTQ